MKHVLKILIVLVASGMWGCELYDTLTGVEPNTRPTILLKVEDTTPDIGTTQTITAEIYDPDENDEVTVTWEVSAGELSQTHGTSIDWTAPMDTATVSIIATATDTKEGVAHKEVIIYVGNAPPKINSFTVSSEHVVSGNSVNLACSATDPEGGELTYLFKVLDETGELDHAEDTDSTAVWTSPSNTGGSEVYKIAVFVSDELNFTSSDTLDVLVYSNYGSLWVVDSDHKTLTKYTSNGYKILTSSQSFSSPVAIAGAVDELGGCFVADQGSDQVYKLDYNGNQLETYSGISHVIDIALHQYTQKLWALSYNDGTVTVIDQRTGNVEKTIYGFEQPTQIDINQYNGDVWIVEEGNNRVIQFNITEGVDTLPDSLHHMIALGDTVMGEGAMDFTTDFNGPMDLFIHHRTDVDLSQVFIADTYDNQIERFSFRDGTYQRLAPVSPLSASPQLLGVITVNLVDMVLVINASGDLELFEINNVLQKHALNGNYQFVKPQVLTIEKSTGECWIGDNGTNQLVKIKIVDTNSFTVQRRLDGFLSIRDIVINR